MAGSRRPAAPACVRDAASHELFACPRAASPPPPCPDSRPPPRLPPAARRPPPATRLRPARRRPCSAALPPRLPAAPHPKPTAPAAHYIPAALAARCTCPGRAMCATIWHLVGHTYLKLIRVSVAGSASRMRPRTLMVAAPTAIMRAATSNLQPRCRQCPPCRCCPPANPPPRPSPTPHSPLTRPVVADPRRPRAPVACPLHAGPCRPRVSAHCRAAAVPTR
ncbi:hypothetical protein GGX14DRAFT_563825 [Mycena pura]|uniref:Uncharacterized protein n=1 Tax=Mycena pura TaxID=153505 RepID=A0AAD6VLL3_9AGAR|nr:hypothetical protein GGX14DRAFT_563825 [Mycena pura]